MSAAQFILGAIVAFNICLGLFFLLIYLTTKGVPSCRADEEKNCKYPHCDCARKVGKQWL